MNDVDPYQRALESYELAYSRVVQARNEWERAGRPFVVEHRNRMLGVAPIWRALREAERDAARALEVIRLRHSGPDPVARVRSSIGESPAQKLRRIK
jgi:hypothetical protein